MKLNYDCLRDTLLFLEEIPAYDDDGFANYMFFDYSAFPNHLLEKYPKEEIMYSFNQLRLSGMIDASDSSTSSGPAYFFRTILPSGHELISNIKSDTIWSDVKDKIKVVGNVSLPVLSTLAQSLILKLLGL